MSDKTSENIYSEQRIGVFVDVQTMYYSARNISKATVNFNSILTEAVI